MDLRCPCSRPDAPMFISHPHFYNADPSLVNAVEGLHPSKEHHALFLDVHPVGGLAVVSSPQRGLFSHRGRVLAKQWGGGACHCGLLALLCSCGADLSRFQSAKWRGHVQIKMLKP